MGALIAGIAVSALVSAISGKMGADAQKEAADIVANATAEEKAKLQEAYDSTYGAGSYNDRLQQMGLQANIDYRKLLDDESKWNLYVDGERAYRGPEQFSFTAEDLFEDPSYKFRLQQGLDSVSQSAVAAGLGKSTAASKMLNKFAQDSASQEYAAAYGRNRSAFENDRNFDYSTWLQQSQQYYNNLLQQLNGLNNISQTGNQAAASQAKAFAGLAGGINELTETNAEAQGQSAIEGNTWLQPALGVIATGATALGTAKAGYKPQEDFDEAPNQQPATFNPSIGWGVNANPTMEGYYEWMVNGRPNNY